MSADVAKVIGIVAIVGTVLGLLLAGLSARKPAPVRLRLDLFRLVVQFGSIVAVAVVTAVSTPSWATAVALVAGLALGGLQGNQLRIRSVDGRVLGQRSWVGVAIWGIGLLATQLVSLGARSGWLEVGQGLAYFGASTGIGLLLGRTRPLGEARRVAAAGAVGVVATAALATLAALAVGGPAAAQTRVTDAQLCALLPASMPVGAVTQTDPASGIRYCQTSVRDQRGIAAYQVFVGQAASTAAADGYYGQEAAALRVPSPEGLSSVSNRSFTVGDEILATYDPITYVITVFGRRGPFILGYHHGENSSVSTSQLGLLLREVDQKIVALLGGTSAAPTPATTAPRVTAPPAVATTAPRATVPPTLAPTVVPTSPPSDTSALPPPVFVSDDPDVEPAQAAAASVVGLVGAGLVGLIGLAELAGQGGRRPRSPREGGDPPGGDPEPPERADPLPPWAAGVAARPPFPVLDENGVPLVTNDGSWPDAPVGHVWWHDGHPSSPGAWISPEDAAGRVGQARAADAANAAERAAAAGHHADRATADWDAFTADSRARAEAEAAARARETAGRAARREAADALSNALDEAAMAPGGNEIEQLGGIIDFLDRNPTPTAEELARLNEMLRQQLADKSALDRLRNTGFVADHFGDGVADYAATWGDTKEKLATWTEQNVGWPAGTFVRWSDTTAYVGGRVAVGVATGGWSEILVGAPGDALGAMHGAQTEAIATTGTGLSVPQLIGVGAADLAKGELYGAAIGKVAGPLATGWRNTFDGMDQALKGSARAAGERLASGVGRSAPPPPVPRISPSSLPGLGSSSPAPPPPLPTPARPSVLESVAPRSRPGGPTPPPRIDTDPPWTPTRAPDALPPGIDPGGIDVAELPPGAQPGWDSGVSPPRLGDLASPPRPPASPTETLPAVGGRAAGPRTPAASTRWSELGADGRGRLYDPHGNHVLTVDENGVARTADGTPVQPIVDTGTRRVEGYVDPSGRQIVHTPDGQPQVLTRTGIDPNAQVKVGDERIPAGELGLDHPDSIAADSFTEPAVGTAPAVTTARAQLPSEVRAQWAGSGAGPSGELYGPGGEVIGKIDANGQMWTNDGREIVGHGPVVDGRHTRVTTADGMVHGDPGSVPAPPRGAGNPSLADLARGTAPRTPSPPSVPSEADVPTVGRVGPAPTRLTEPPAPHDTASHTPGTTGSIGGGTT